MRVAAQTALPAAFSWRSYPHPVTGQTVSAVTPARDQFSPQRTGTCWAHVTLGALESLTLIDAVAADPGTDPSAPLYDYSEYDLVRCAPREERTCINEGRVESSVAYLTRAGAVAEACAPLALCFASSPPGCVEDCPRLVTPLGWEWVGAGVEDIKEALYHHGPVITPVHTKDTNFFSLAPGAVWYWPGRGDEGLNHGLVIVGWDDAKEVYDGATLVGRGAWEVKNSNPKWADQGFGWVAYGSGRIGSFASVFTEVQPYDPEEIVYYYDDWGQTGAAGDERPGPEWGLVSFTLRQSGRIQRVEFWTVSDHTSYKIRLYDQFDGRAPRKLKASQDGSCGRRGYCSVRLAEPAEVLVADNIYVAVEFEAPDTARPVPVDRRGPFAPGRSYLSADGKTWTPLNNQDLAIRLRVTPEDSDRDGLPDYWERAYRCMKPKKNDAEDDYDGDGLANIDEYGFARALYGASTDPCTPDTDADGLPDAWEAQHRACLHPTIPDAPEDPDRDGASNLQEFSAGTDPCAPLEATGPRESPEDSDYRTEAERLGSELYFKHK